MFQNNSRPPPSDRALRGRIARLLEVVAAADAATSKGQPADDFMARYFATHRACGSKDRRFLADHVFAFFRWRGWTVPSAPPDYPAALLHTQALDTDAWSPAMRYLMAEHPEIIVPNEPIGHAELRDKAQAFATWTGASAPPLPESLMPTWAQPMLHVPANMEKELHQQWVEALQQRPPTWLRLAKGREQAGIDALAANNHSAQRHPTMASAVSCERAVSREILMKEKIEIQDLASQAVGIVCDPKPGEQWWDVCAGAGGKTLQWADQMEGRGRIIATDVRPEALRELERRARRADQESLISIIKRDGRDFVPRNRLDGVLVDAPCSGLGTWSRAPDARWRMTPDYLQQVSTLQSELLHHAAQFVRPGGSLIYAVCTVTTAETLAITTAFEQAHPDFTPANPRHPLTHARGDGGPVWIWPWEGPCDGMFIARWTRATDS